jgi:lipid A Kdo2 1-phosphate O-methyltransferase
MALQEEFESNGNWLFRWRSYLPLTILAITLYSLKSFSYIGGEQIYDDLWEAICIAVCFFGLAIRAYTIGHTPANTSGRNTKQQVADELNTTGIYSIVRHPLYLGNYFMGLGIVLFIHAPWILAVYTLSFWVYYERIMFAEEAFLRRKFGKSYTDWAKETPAFIPRLRNFRKPNLPFSLKNVLKREYNGFYAIVAPLFILEVVGDYFVEHKIQFETSWVVFFIIGTVLFIGLRTIRRKTTLLEVKGR